MRMPEALGLYLCQRFEPNPHTRQVSLVGLFNAWHFPAFPVDTGPFDVFATLHGGVGQGTMELVISRMVQEKDLYRTYGDWRCPGRDRLSYIHRRVPGIPLLGPGWYTLTLRFNDEVVSYREVPVYRAESKS